MSLLNNLKVPERLNLTSNHVYALSIYNAIDNKLVDSKQQRSNMC